MSQQATRDAILRGTYYERVIKPLCDADKREKAAAADRAIKAARFRARPRTVVGRILPGEIATRGEP
jgi:hypothetical protein